MSGHRVSTTNTSSNSDIQRFLITANFQLSMFQTKIWIISAVPVNLMTVFGRVFHVKRFKPSKYTEVIISMILNEASHLDKLERTFKQQGKVDD